MLIEIAPDAREPLRPLFAGCPGMHGVLDVALEGAMGAAFADDAARPSVAMLELDFYLLGGDRSASAAEEAVRSLTTPCSIVVSDEAWAPLLRRAFGERLHTRTRVAFQPGDWDRPRLRGFIEALPDALEVRRIGSGDAARFEELADSLVYNFASLEDFVERGAGYGIEQDGRFVSGCSSYAIGSSSLEFEIQTHRDERQRGLATACAARMIEHCLDHGLEPCWDAHNDISASLATKLGFTNPKPYIAYDVPS